MSEDSNNVIRYPYRQMDPYEEPTVADRMREETQRALEDAVQKRVDSMLVVIADRAKRGFSDATWPTENFTKKEACDEIAEALELKGFDCQVRTHERRWFRSVSPEEFVWEVFISW